MLTVSLRVTSIFGEGDTTIVGGVVSQARSGQLKVQIGDGKNCNEWTYVGNVAAAHTFAAKRLLGALETPDPPDRRVDGEAFFVTNDDPRPVWEFARQVAREAGYPIESGEVTKLPAFMAYIVGFISEWTVYISSFGRRKAEVSRRTTRFCVANQTFCVDKMKRQLGFTPAISIDEGIKRSVAPLLAGKQTESAKIE